MPKLCRTKWVVNEVVDYGKQFGGASAKRAKLSNVYSGDKNHEDNQFSSATPQGNCEQMITNPETSDFFEPGVKYYAVWERCEDQS